MKRTLMIFLIPFIFTAAGTTGKLTGQIIDENTGQTLPFANITISGTNLGAATNLDGKYVILNIPPGKYSIKFQYIGFQTKVADNVSISIDQTTKINVSLSEASLEIGEVVVQAQYGGIQKDVTSSQSLISSEKIDALPVSELDDILQLQAGVSRDSEGNFHIRGGRTSEIAYWVNGISITDAYDNSKGIQIDNNSIQEVQVISGTFNAEFGNAMSGIVNIVTKEGGADYHGSLLLYAGDHASNFDEYFPHISNINLFSNYNFQGSFGGAIPFTNDLVKFFVNGRYFYDDGYLFGGKRFNVDGSAGDNSVVSMDWSKNYYGQGKLSFFPIQELKVNLEGLYSEESFRDYNHEYRWNPEGDVSKFSNSYNFSGSVTHTLSSSTFYTVKGSYFFKDFNEYLYENPLDSRYLHPDSLLISAKYSFRTKGTNLHRFFRETKTLLGKLDFTSQIAEEHLVRFGIEVKSHQLKFDDYNLEPLRINGIPVEPFQSSIPGITQTNRDLYENEPLEASVYLQDKIEFENVIINVGLRLDYFDSNGKVLVDVTDPNINAPLRPELEELSIEEREPFFYKNAGEKLQISPRFGIAYPISESGVVHFSYGHFLQIPPSQYLFQKGPYKVPNSGINVGVYGNPDLEPQKTVMYEIGFRHDFFDNYLLDVTGFYRDVRDWITSGAIVQTRNLVTYSIFTNKDYANVKGITLTINKKYSNNIAFDINYTYQLAEGSNSKPEDEFEAAKGSNEPSLFLIPMDWDQNHLFNASIFTEYENFGISLLARYNTGLPYTPSITQYTADRGITSGLLKNSRRIPNQFNLDLKIDKSLYIYGLDINLFLKIYNLLDTQNVIKVFGDTGQPDFTTETQNIGESEDRPNTIEEYIKYPDHYGEPRNVQFGIKLSF